MPTYSRPEGVHAAVASVLAQTFTDLEVIVTDDSEHSQDLARDFPDDRLRYFPNPERLGMAANWQRGLSLARGRYVGLLMDDDWLLPTYVERCLAVFEEEAATGVVFANHFFDEGGKLTPRRSVTPAGRHDHFLPLLLAHKPVAVSATLMRREVWDDVLPVPPIHTADMALHIRAAEAGWSFHYIDEPLMTYRLHETQLSRTLQFRDHEVELWRQFGFAPGSPEESLRRSLLAKALLSSAAGHMQRRDFEEARKLAEEAEALGLGPAELSWRDRLVLAISKHRAMMRSAVLGFRVARRVQR